MSQRSFLILFSLFIFSISLAAQGGNKTDFLQAEVAIRINPEDEEISGTVHYTLEALASLDVITLDARKMKFSEVRVGGKKARFDYDGRHLKVYRKFKPGQQYELSLAYLAHPEEAVYFIGWDYPGDEDGMRQVWTQGQGKYSSHWLPGIDDMTEKMVYDLQITFDKDYFVTANGIQRFVSVADSTATWSFDMDKPMSSYLLAFVIGNYEKKELTSESGVPIELYYYPGDSLYTEPTYRYSAEIFNILEKEIGVPYPWQVYRQLPVRDFLYAGMENTSTTIFSDAYVIDSLAFTDKNYVNVNAHELAHQWFGNLVTEVSGEHHWLHEGFASYYALLAERELFGDDYFYWKLFESARTLDRMSQQGKGESLLDPNAGSLTFYEKGAWALFALRELVGDKLFNAGIISFLQRYAYANATVEDFLHEMETTSTEDLTTFKEQWLDSRQFPYREALHLLAESNEDIRDFRALQNSLTVAKDSSRAILLEAWNKNDSDLFRANLVSDYHKLLPAEVLSELMANAGIKSRQALALSNSGVPDTLTETYESFLEDPSYVTKENALFKLWVHHPEGRADYLRKTNGIKGLPNYNIRLLWLTLALFTKDYEPGKEEEFFNELSGYTDPKYPFDIRIGAFRYLEEARMFTEKNILDLLFASAHHSWQFRKFARNLLERLMKDDKQLARIRRVAAMLPEGKATYINQKLKEL
ncbi:M1 family metallopeptidase [Zeaxanthinibacter enoshimensis]|uniref:Aminopeptidase N n=1 Tax=Zeaxanthinibacter enoshimensis TaxID=392009 RepID=A0A4R6TN33_9FLAO|nr:M1 family metallopeptidase [Zeaxanthinibacter enoshimensis]TDQ31298.1 aminopeptidase N [Zeaxanthinibacter enoshimensis]